MQLPRFILQEPNLVEKPWGGRWIARFKGIDEKRRIGESWEFSTHASKPSYVLIRGRRVNLLDLLKRAGKEILGREARVLPILVKLLDINTRISVQVHPNDETARLLGEEDAGKDEAWLVLHGGRVYIGFRETIDPKDEQLTQPEIVDKMNSFDAEYLDSFKIPAGTIHCAEKVRVLELSSNSNLTYRIHDFEGRGTQIEKAIRALKLQVTRPEDVKGEKGRIEMGKFGAEVVKVSGVEEFRLKGFNILIPIDGSVVLQSGGEILELRKGQSCLVPAMAGEYRIEGKGVLVCRIYTLN
jgi:mannose-6-phosphate isomerase